jgi:hypothetical protein
MFPPSKKEMSNGEGQRKKVYYPARTAMGRGKVNTSANLLILLGYR